jgi:hypothetical protein
MIFAVAGGSDLLQRTQPVFFQKKQSKVTKVSIKLPGPSSYILSYNLLLIYIYMYMYMQATSL